MTEERRGEIKPALDAGDNVSADSGGLGWLPPHKCGLYLEHNAHRDVYESVEDAVEELGASWVSPGERNRALQTGEIWTLQWYPETPVGFNLIAASSLEALRKALLPRR